MGWAIMVVLIAGAELAVSRTIREVFVRGMRALPLLSPVIPMLLWRSEAATQMISFPEHFIYAKAVIFASILKGLWLPLDTAMSLAILIAAAVAVASAAGRRVEPRLATGGALLVLAALVMPAKIFGSWGADLRLAPVAAIVLLASIGPAVAPARERALFTIGLALFAIRAGWTTVAWSRAEAVLETRLAIVNDVPAGSRMGYFHVVEPCRRTWTRTADLHVGSYAVIRRNLYTNSLFNLPGGDVLLFRVPGDGERWVDPSQFLFRKDCRDVGITDIAARLNGMAASGFDYIWVAGLKPDSVPRPTGYEVVRVIDTDVMIRRP
jgi:hypothetical protein